MLRLFFWFVKFRRNLLPENSPLGFANPGVWPAKDDLSIKPWLTELCDVWTHSKGFIASHHVLTWLSHSVFTGDIVQLLIDRSPIATFKGINWFAVFIASNTEKDDSLVTPFNRPRAIAKTAADMKGKKLLQAKITVHYYACWNTVNCAEQMCNNTSEVHSKSQLIQRSNINFLRVRLMGCQAEHKFWHISLATSNVR